MNKRQKLIATLGMGIVCGVVLRSAFSKSEKAATPADPPATAGIADNDSKPSGQPGQPSAVASPSYIATNEVQGPPQVVETGAVESDGKTVLPTDGKESLPPVGESIGSKPQIVDPSNPGAPTEYLGTTTNPSSANPLLEAPSPQNVSGPVISAETKETR